MTTGRINQVTIVPAVGMEGISKVPPSREQRARKRAGPDVSLFLPEGKLPFGESGRPQRQQQHPAEAFNFPVFRFSLVVVRHQEAVWLLIACTT